MWAGLAVWAGLWAGCYAHKILLQRDLMRPDRIVGGEPVSPGEFLWQVSLQEKFGKKTYQHFCGGTLITPGWVVTAAHCTTGIDYDHVVVVTGAQNLRDWNNRYRVAKVIKGPYNSLKLENDIALLKLDLKNPLQVSTREGSGAVPIGLEGRKEAGVDPSRASRTECSISGWGRLKEGGTLPTVLMAADVELKSDVECNNMFSSNGYSVHSSNLCAGGGKKDACQGDSGGPLVCCDKNTRTPSSCRLAGITSWGIGCATPLLPGVYTEVAHYVDWVEKQIRDEDGEEGLKMLKIYRIEDVVVEEEEVSEVDARE